MSGDGLRTFRVTCPRNCYDTCGMLATVENGVLLEVAGDPLHPNTNGRLCSKGYSYVERVYSTDRIRHPMVQTPKGSGRWRRVSWDEALDRIARRLIDIADRHGSLLPVCLYKGSGNIGLLHNAPEAMFAAMGPHTVALNVLCWAAGRAAQEYDFGVATTSDPGELLKARTLLLWGVNPAWTATHQMSLVMEARDQGTRVITIDPIATATACRSDQHVAPRPGTDGALALGMARCILDAGLQDELFLGQHVQGWPQFAAYLREQVTLEWAAAATALRPEVIRDLAVTYATGGPAMIWMGFGLQRHDGAVETVRAIDALAAMTGQIGRPGTGVQFANMSLAVLGDHLRSYRGSVGQPYTGPGSVDGNRTVAMGRGEQAIRTLTGPPIEMVWIAGGNPVAQEPDAAHVPRLMRALDLVVVVDQFMTATAREADIVLPATTCLEQWDLHVSYWHHHASITERALAPLYEARSDLAIARALSARLNELSPGFSVFPTEGDERDWVRRELEEPATRQLVSASVEQLQQGPVRLNLPETAWESLTFATPSGRIELWSEAAVANGLPALPVYRAPVAAPPAYPVRLLTPHRAESLHSQFADQAGGLSRPVLEIHPRLAEYYGLAEGARVRAYNARGELLLPVRLTRTVPADTVVAYEGVFADPRYNVNLLTEPTQPESGFPGVAYGDCFVALEPAPEEE